MTWNNIEDRLSKPLRTKMQTTDGAVWLPDAPVGIDSWLSSIARTDEEFRELEMSRFRFLENRWPIERLVEFDSDVGFDRVALLAMHVGQRAYILLKHEDYELIGAVEPATSPALYPIVIGPLVSRGISTWRGGTHVNWRPDLIPNGLIGRLDRFNTVDGVQQIEFDDDGNTAKGAQVLFGWLGLWFDVPLVRYWSEDSSDSRLTLDKETIIMKYKATYGDKQRDAQRRRKEEEQQGPKPTVPNSQQQPNNPNDRNSTKRASHDKDAA